jgi:hypothetical protein
MIHAHVLREEYACAVVTRKSIDSTGAFGPFSSFPAGSSGARSRRNFMRWTLPSSVISKREGLDADEGGSEYIRNKKERRKNSLPANSSTNVRRERALFKSPFSVVWKWWPFSVIVLLKLMDRSLPVGRGETDETDGIKTI